MPPQRSRRGADGGERAREQLHVQARRGGHGHARLRVEVGEQVVPGQG